MKRLLLTFALFTSFASPIIAQDSDEWPMLRQSHADNEVEVTRTASQKLGFHGATPVVQRVGAAQVALTDSTGGSTADTTLAATAGVTVVSIPLTLASIADGDMLTNYTPGFKFKVLAVDFVTTTVATTSAKASTLNVEIGTTNLTGGVVSLTTSSCDTRGEITAGTSVTAANTGSATDTISVEASSTTTFVEGAGTLLIKIQNMDTADNMAKTARLTNELRASLVQLGLILGSDD